MQTGKKAESRGILYMVSTPIGNLRDITIRALECLKTVDYVYAEDTRVTQKIFRQYEIQTVLRSYHENSPVSVMEEIMVILVSGKSAAITSDAGTPGIMDPGARLIQYLLAEDPEQIIVPIPGASAIAAALSVSGVATDNFVFFGYPPHKRKRRAYFSNLNSQAVRPIVIYESPHRLLKTLSDIQDAFGPLNKIIVFQELTKVFERVYRGDTAGAQSFFPRNNSRGEFVLMIL